jgi:hypothetical protein
MIYIYNTYRHNTEAYESSRPGRRHEATRKRTNGEKIMQERWQELEKAKGVR